MSFDVFVQPFWEQVPLAIDRVIVEQAFLAIIESQDEFGWSLADDTFLFISSDEAITSFCINRPTADIRLWNAVFDVLQRSPSVVFWPGGGCCVAAAQVSRHLPEGFVEELGTPIVVTEGGQICDVIARSG